MSVMAGIVVSACLGCLFLWAVLLIHAVNKLERDDEKKQEPFDTRMDNLRSAIRPLATTASKAGCTSNENEAA